MLIADGGGGGSAIPAPPPPPPEPSLKDKFVKNLSGFPGGAGAGGADAAKGLGQLGYDVFIGSSPFVDDKTRQETKARAEARGELYKHPSTLVAAITQPYRNDIATGHDERAAGRAVFDIGSLVVGGGATKAGKAGAAVEGERVLFGQARISPHFSPEGKVPELRGRHIEDVAEDLRSDKLSPDVFNIRAWREGGELVTENNRGLGALSLAGKRPQVGVNLTIVSRDQIAGRVLDRLNETNVFGDTLPSTRIGVTPSQADLTLVSPFEIHIP